MGVKEPVPARALESVWPVTTKFLLSSGAAIIKPVSPESALSKGSEVSGWMGYDEGSRVGDFGCLSVCETSFWRAAS